MGKKEPPQAHLGIQGVSGVGVISKSHLAIHTWPELGYAAVDCGERVNPWDAFHFMAEKFGTEDVHASEIKRGYVPGQEERLAVNLGGILF